MLKTISLFLLLFLIGFNSIAQVRNKKVDSLEKKLVEYGMILNHVRDEKKVSKYLDSMVMMLNPLHKYYYACRDTANFKRVVELEMLIIQIRGKKTENLNN